MAQGTIAYTVHTDWSPSETAEFCGCRSGPRSRDVTRSGLGVTQSQPARLPHGAVGGTEEVTAQPVKFCAPRRDVQSFLCCIPVSLWQRDHPSQQKETKWASPRGQLLPPCCWPSSTPVPSMPVCPCDQTVNWRGTGPAHLDLQISPRPNLVPAYSIAGRHLGAASPAICCGLHTPRCSLTPTGIGVHLTKWEVR